MIDGFARLEIAGADPSAYAVLLGGDLETGGVTVAPAARTRIVLATGDPDETRKRLERRAVSFDENGDALLGGLPIGLSRRGSVTHGAVELDHVVVHTSSAQRAVADYAGRLGLDLRLERHAPQWGSHMLFLRCGGAILEVVQPLGEDAHVGPDAVWGAAWRVPDVEQARAALDAAGLVVSETRPGRKPGSRVCTVADPRFGVPTLLIEHGRL